MKTINNKYNKTISKINASEELKSNIILKMKEEEKKYIAKESHILKLKNLIIKLIAVSGILACSGVAYAAIADRIIAGINFSENYEKYEEQIENQYVEKDGNIVTLKSIVCDDGFLVMNFRITLSDKETEGLTYLSFNDEVITDGGYEHTNLSGANYNLIIDGEKYWLRGSTTNEIKGINEKEYELYQIWFLPDEILNNKNTFTITLNNVILSLNDDTKLITMDNGFEIEVSKEKTLENTTKFNGNNATVTYKKLSKTIEQVSITPLQNIVKISNVRDIIDKESLVYLPSDNYIGDIRYKVYDQNGNEISEFDTKSYLALKYEDGTIEEFGLDLGYSINDRDFTNVKEISTEYLVIEQNEDITELNIELYEENQYYEEVRKIGSYHINLTNQHVTAKSTDEIIQSNREKIMQEELEHEINIEDIKEFNIEIPGEFEGKYKITKYENGGPISIDEGKTTTYYLDFGYNGKLAFYLIEHDLKDEEVKELNNKSDKEYFMIIDKNQKYSLVAEFITDDVSYDNFYNDVKDIIGSIKLK